MFSANIIYHKKYHTTNGEIHLKSNSQLLIMDESTPFEVKYQNKTAILTVSKDNIECKIGNNVTFSIPTTSIRGGGYSKKTATFAKLAAKK